MARKKTIAPKRQLGTDRATPKVEILIREDQGATDSPGFRASRKGKVLTEEQAQELHKAIDTFMIGFKPPKAASEPGRMNLEELEVEIGFELVVNTGSIIKVFVGGATATAGIKATARWKRSEAE
jgi:hypothetical protein